MTSETYTREEVEGMLSLLAESSLPSDLTDRRIDLVRAVRALDPFLRRVVWEHGVLRRPIRAAADDLGCSHTWVQQCWKEAVCQLTTSLNR